MAGDLFGYDTLSGAFETAATASSGVGTYAITPGTNAALSDDVLSVMGSNLTITPRAITVAADAGSRVLGATNPRLTYSVSEGGLVSGDRLFGELTTSAPATSPAGVYPILIGTLGTSPNYTLTLLRSQLTVSAPETPSARPPGGDHGRRRGNPVADADEGADGRAATEHRDLAAGHTGAGRAVHVAERPERERELVLGRGGRSVGGQSRRSGAGRSSGASSVAIRQLDGAVPHRAVSGPLEA